MDIEKSAELVQHLHSHDLNGVIFLKLLLFFLYVNAVCEVWIFWGEFPHIGLSLCSGKANAPLRRITYRTRA